MQPLSEIAYAKINLALHVRGRRADGYHDLETIFAFVDQGDLLTALPSASLSLNISGPFGDGLSVTDNLVLDAAELLKAHCGIVEGAELSLQKMLPVASGIGGGSADAAAALRLLNRLWECGLDLRDLAVLSASLGADVPACVYSGTMIGTGTGTDLKRIDDQLLTGMPILLANPLEAVSTAEVFGGWSGDDDGPLGEETTLDAAKAGKNGLEQSAIALCPEIQEVLAGLKMDQKPLLARMSGSGATCFALYENAHERDVAHKALQQTHPDWWYMAAQIR